jgi:hypothetical protein
VLELIRDHGAVILGAIGTVTLAFLTPFGAQVIARRFSRRPAFSVDSSTINNSLQLIVRPANRAARKKRKLGVRVRGLIITTASKLETSETVFWRIDLSNVRGMRDILQHGQDYEFEFFFDPNNSSDKVTIRYVEPQNFLSALSASTPSEIANAVQTVTHPHELVANLRSNVSFFCDFDEERSIISRAFPTTNSKVFWASVHDGKELQISDIDRLELTGTRILADPRYAWVLNFEHCTNLALRHLTIGHTKSGYCMGGVLRFKNCKNITLEDCQLFGCGTYGLEFVDCENIEVVGTTIKECTYGAVRLTNVSSAAFRGCQIHNNEGFELFELDGLIEGVTLQDCNIFQNKIRGAIFCFSNHIDAGFYVHNSLCSENECAEITNLEDSKRYYFDKEDNRIVPSSWSTNRPRWGAG